VTAVVVGAYEDAATAVAALAPAGGKRRAAVLPRASVDDEARVRLRQAQVECLSTLDGGDLAAARRLAAARSSAFTVLCAPVAAPNAGSPRLRPLLISPTTGTRATAAGTSR